MKRKVTAQTVIIHFYALYLNEQPPGAEILRKANLLIEKCNENMAREGDKYLSDALKQVDAEDYNSWMKVFPLAQNSLMSLDTNAVFDQSLFHAVLTEKPYLSQSLRVYLSPGRYYDREHKVFQQVMTQERRSSTTSPPKSKRGRRLPSSVRLARARRRSSTFSCAFMNARGISSLTARIPRI